MSACSHCGADDEKVEFGEEVAVRVRKPIGAILAVRVPGTMAGEVDAEARRLGITMSELIREAITQRLHPQLSWSVSTGTATSRTYQPWER